jgi:glutaredoxin 2
MTLKIIGKRVPGIQDWVVGEAYVSEAFSKTICTDDITLFPVLRVLQVLPVLPPKKILHAPD